MNISVNFRLQSLLLASIFETTAELIGSKSLFHKFSTNCNQIESKPSLTTIPRGILHGFSSGHMNIGCDVGLFHKDIDAVDAIDDIKVYMYMIAKARNLCVALESQLRIYDCNHYTLKSVVQINYSSFYIYIYSAPSIDQVHMFVPPHESNN